MIRRLSAERAALPLLIGAVLIAFVVVGVATGGGGHGAKVSAGQDSKVKRAAATPTNQSPPTSAVPAGGSSPGEVARHFAAAFEAESWRDTPGSLGSRVAPWAAPSLKSLLSAPAQAGPPAAYVAEHSVTGAKVASVGIDRVDATDDLAVIGLVLTTTSKAAPASSMHKVLALKLRLADGRWAVTSVPGLVP